jgi:hypothetical protein
MFVVSELDNDRIFRFDDELSYTMKSDARETTPIIRDIYKTIMMCPRKQIVRFTHVPQRQIVGFDK